MNRIYTLLSKLLLIGSFLLVGMSHSSAQINDSALALLKNMSPEQFESVLKMAVNLMPPDKRAEIEESLKAMKSKTPEIKTVKLKNKTVAFVPIAHVSTPEFYAGVKHIVEEYKANGYTVYYEQIKGGKPQTGTMSREGRTDTPLVDTLRLKLRKIMGLEPTRQTYAILKRFFPDVVTQPEYKDLGITETDLNADVYIGQLIAAYEQKYGPIELASCDYTTGFDTFLYPCEKLNNDLNAIILDYRNEYVANLIKSAKDKKILVLYGARHIDGMMKLIQSN